MTGYVRKDTSNNIADGNIINAADLDAEFDGVVDAFNASTGHKHDGTTGEGAPITVVGPTQDVAISATAVTPKTTNTVDLGSSSLKFKDIFIADTATLPTVNATTVDTTNIEVTNIKAKDGTASATIADSTGVMTIASAILTTADINGGTIDGATIATSNITVGAGKTLDVSAGTLMLANDQISGDKVEGGTIAATTITTLTSTTGNITTVNATTVDTTNVEVTNIKAKDGTASASIADSTGVMTIASAILTTADINGGTIDGTVIGGTAAAAGAFTTLSASGGITGNLTGNVTGSVSGNAGTVTNGVYTIGDQTIAGIKTFSSNPVITAGTANGVAYLNGSKVLTTGSALTFDGSTLGTTGALRVDGNTTLGDASTDTVTVNGYMGVGGAAQTRAGLWLTSSALSGGAQEGIVSLPVGTSAATATIRAIVGKASTAAASFTVANLSHLYADDATKGAGSTITNQHGVYIADQTQGTNNYGITSLVSSGSNKWNIYASGTAANYFAGRVYVNGIDSTETASFLQVKTATNNYVRVRNNAGVSSIWSGTTDGTLLQNLEVAGSPITFVTGTTPTERLRIDSSGNLGLGVTPSAWATYKTLQVGAQTAIANTGAFSVYGTNWYYDGADKYVTTGNATQYYQNAGTHVWRTAPSGTAGNAISFTQAMTLNASGNLGVGLTSPATSTTGSGTVDANGPLLSRGAITTNQTNAGVLQYASNETRIRSFGATAGTGIITFSTGGGGGSADTERARIDSSGNLLVGTTSNGSGAQFFVVANKNTYAMSAWNYNAAPLGLNIYYASAAPNNTGSEFFVANDSVGIKASVRSNGGIANFSGNNVNLSDRREKTNFAPAKSYLETICAIPVQTFNYIDQNMEEDPGLTLGVVAQDVQAVAPELVMESNWGTEDEPKMRLSIYQTDLQYALMKCIQEQQAIIEELKADVAALKGAA